MALMAKALTVSRHAGLRTILRDETSELHRRVERHPLLAPLMKPGLTRQAYALVLKAFHEFYVALEPWLLPALQSGWPDPELYHYQCRAALLAHDLRDLGYRPMTPPARPLACESPIELGSRGSVLGVLYVLEGATQGGSVIAPRVVRELGLSPGFGARYFHLYADQCWDDVLALMAAPSLQSCSRRAVESARQTFLTLQVYLDHWHQVALRS